MFTKFWRALFPSPATPLERALETKERELQRLRHELQVLRKVVAGRAIEIDALREDNQRLTSLLTEAIEARRKLERELDNHKDLILQVETLDRRTALERRKASGGA